MADPNLPVALGLGRVLAPHGPSLPAALADVRRRAEFVNEIDCTWLVDGEGAVQWADFGRRLENAATASTSAMPEVGDPLERMSIALRLWAGCLSAAKTIAEDTRSGMNTAADRSQVFARVIDPTAAADPVFRAGVEAAPALHALRGQPCFLDGVPTDSSVRRYADRCSEGRADASGQ